MAPIIQTIEGVVANKFVDEDEIDFEKNRKVKKSWIPGIFYSKD